MTKLFESAFARAYAGRASGSTGQEHPTPTPQTAERAAHPAPPAPIIPAQQGTDPPEVPAAPHREVVAWLHEDFPTTLALTNRIRMIWILTARPDLPQDDPENELAVTAQQYSIPVYR